MKYILIIFSFLLFNNGIFAQKIYGKVLDDKGEPLSFATVYIVGTSTGTTSNINGKYELEIGKGEYQIAFQYIGY